MSAAVEYRACAARCASAAARTVDRDNKVQFTELAGAWLRLAELAEKYSLNDVASMCSPPPVK